MGVGKGMALMKQLIRALRNSAFANSREGCKECTDLFYNSLPFYL